MTSEVPHDLDKQIVCVLPDRFAMTDDKWLRIVVRWKLNDRRILTAEEITDLFKLDR